MTNWNMLITLNKKNTKSQFPFTSLDGSQFEHNALLNINTQPQTRNARQ